MSARGLLRAGGRWLTAAMLLAALAAGGKAVPSPASAAMIWRRGEAMDPGTFDPHKASTVADSRVLGEIYEGLVVHDGEGRLVPGVAARWEISPDRLRYTFHLRPDARWSNGDAVTAADFVFAFRRLMDPRTGARYASVLYDLRNARRINAGALPPEALGVAAPDPLTVVVDLEHPAPYLLAQLTHFTALPLHRPEVEQDGPAFARAGRLVGNGPFVLTRYVPNDRVVLAKNPFFHDAAAVALDGEVFLPMEDASAGLRRFMAGEVDSFPSVPVEDLAAVRAALGPAFKVAPTLASYFYAFDCRQRPFDDARVRRALAMVVDRRFLAGAIWGGTMLPGYSLVPPGIASYGAPSTVAWKDDSPFAREDEARRLLAEAGYGPAHPLRLTFRSNQGENHRATAIAVADMWRVLGVETSFLVTDATTHYAFLASGQPYDVARSGWFADYADAQNFLFLGESGNRGLNYAHYANPAFDALMRDAEVEPDEARRRDLLHRAERLLLADQPFLVLMSYEATNLVSPKLRGWSANIMDHHPGRYISIAP